MRTGVLSDDYIKKHNPELFPLDATTSDNIYGRLIHNKPEKKRPAKRIFRTTAPYIEHHELSKMLNMLNVEPHIENFERKLRQFEQSEYQSLEGAYELMKNRYKGVKQLTPFTAAYILEAGIDPMDKYGVTGRNGYGQFFRHDPHTKQPYTLNDVHEKVIDQFRRNDAALDDFRKANNAYKAIRGRMFSGNEIVPADALATPLAPALLKNEDEDDDYWDFLLSRNPLAPPSLESDSDDDFWTRTDVNDFLQFDDSLYEELVEDLDIVPRQLLFNDVGLEDSWWT